jgi:hypothetical protein
VAPVSKAWSCAVTNLGSWLIAEATETSDRHATMCWTAYQSTLSPSFDQPLSTNTWHEPMLPVGAATELGVLTGSLLSVGGRSDVPAAEVAVGDASGECPQFRVQE